MNETITIDGNDYEVLTLDRIGEITHAKLAGGGGEEPTLIKQNKSPQLRGLCHIECGS